MISKLQNDLQAIKMTCKMKRGLQKHFAKPREVVKMPTKPHTMHMKRRALSLRSHTKPLTPFLTSLKPSEPIAPAEETMPPKETTRTKVKVLI